MIGASPELLLRREGQRVETVALAGSARRSDDPSVDEHLAAELLASTKDRGEHDLVVQRIRRTLGTARPLGDRPRGATDRDRRQRCTHLATPIRAQLDGRARLLDLIEALHPTPAVGGEPSVDALRAIPELEGMDRGWYAAPIGWIDRAGDGEFFVGLRSGVVRGQRADSSPASASWVTRSPPASSPRPSSSSAPSSAPYGPPAERLSQRPGVAARAPR